MTRKGYSCRRPAGAGGVCHIHAPGYSPTRVQGSAYVGPLHRLNDQQRSQEAAARRERVKVLYEQGLSAQEIADAMGQSLGAARNHIVRLRKEGRIGRRVAKPIEIPTGLAGSVRSAWVDDGLCIRLIGERFGWTFEQAWSVICRLRREGWDLPSRKAQVVALDAAERREVKRRYKRRRTRDYSDRSVSETLKTVLRILAAAERPLATVEVHGFLTACGTTASMNAVLNRLKSARDAGFVQRASGEVEERCWFERGAGRWFIPVGREQPAASLTLVDAERESELVALIESQQDELKRGDWIDSEKGHWADKSIDAPLTADGFTILDTLGESDEAFDELVEEYA
ncbi:MAG TPA: hypothetical protein VN609_11015 [Propionibacteriaceae bacterium]|nr:hypothetical protein [Propionibacteriaceae bacterium]